MSIPKQGGVHVNGEHEYAENKRDTPERWRRTVDAIVSAVDMACEREAVGCERGGCEHLYKLPRETLTSYTLRSIMRRRFEFV